MPVEPERRTRYWTVYVLIICALPAIGGDIFRAYEGWAEVTRTVVIREPPSQSAITDLEARLGVLIEVELEGPPPEGSGFAGFDLWLDDKLEFSCVGQEEGLFSGTPLRSSASYAPDINPCVCFLSSRGYVARYVGCTHYRHTQHLGRAVWSYVPSGGGSRSWGPALLPSGWTSTCKTVVSRVSGPSRHAGNGLADHSANAKSHRCMLPKPVPPSSRDEVPSYLPLADD